MSGILARKVGMTRIFQEDGTVHPVTVLSCPPSIVTAIKTTDKNGYNAIVLGFDPLKKVKKTKKYKVLKEFRVEKPEEYTVGDEVTVDAFKDTKEVILTSTSKGKGFQGVMKRHNFRSGPGGHGSHAHREGGSIGARSKPGRIHKGKKMAGHMGNEQVTLRYVPLMEVISDKHLLLIKGPVPGPNGGLVIVKKS